MNKCGDCLYFGFCKKYIDPEETFPEIEGGCYVFEKKADYVKVVRCKDCKHKRHNKKHDVILCDHDIGVRGILKPDDFCSYGERREGE